MTTAVSGGQPGHGPPDPLPGASPGGSEPVDVEVVVKTWEQLRAQGCRYTREWLLAGALCLGGPGHRAGVQHGTAAGILTDVAALIPISALPLQPSTWKQTLGRAGRP